jgi:hypothetical protein
MHSVLQHNTVHTYQPSYQYLTNHPSNHLTKQPTNHPINKPTGQATYKQMGINKS